MTIPAISQLKAEARSALEHSRDQKQTALVYSAVLVGSSILVLLLDYLLSRTISGMGGLSNLGTRTILSSLQTMLPIAQSLALLGWNAGYFLVILKMLRRQHPDRKTLSSGFSLFFPMLRCMLLEGFLYFNIAFLSFFLSVQIYSFTPWAKAMIQTLEPVLPAMLENPEGFVLEAAMLDSVLKGILPMMLIFLSCIWCCSFPSAIGSGSAPSVWWTLPGPVPCMPCTPAVCFFAATAGSCSVCICISGGITDFWLLPV